MSTTNGENVGDDLLSNQLDMTFDEQIDEDIVVTDSIFDKSPGKSLRAKPESLPKEKFELESRQRAKRTMAQSFSNSSRPKLFCAANP